MDNLQPMIALNVYLLPEFRQEILSKLVSGLPALPDEIRREVLPAIREEVKISGFRNPFSAPQAVLIRRMESVFLKNSRFVKTIMKAWASMQQASDPALSTVIRSLGFQVNDQVPDYPDPENAFLVGWPEGLSYQKLADLVLAQDPKTTASTDTLALLTVWQTGCLPDPISAGEPA
ncbi:MAG: hypothetical protein AAGU04_02190 [Anaerolineaceae bacterium]